MLKNKRKVLASMLAMSLIMQFDSVNTFADTKNGSTEKAPVFSDVPVKRWSHDIIESFYNSGIIEGYPDGTFRPKEKITRAEVATIIKKLNLDEVKEPIPFTDVTSDMWYSDAVDNSVKIGLTNGYPDGTFKPDNNLTRSEAFKVTAKSYKKADTDYITLDFPDQHTVESWAEEFQKQLIHYEKLEGYPDQTIRGGKDITREEFIKLIGHIVDEDFDIQANLNSWQEDYVDSSNNTENANGENKNPISPVNPVKPINPVTPPDNGGNNDDDDYIPVTPQVPEVPTEEPTIEPKEEQSDKPFINQPFENDTVISGTGIPISTITVTLPNGSKINAIVDNNGTWSISLRTSGYELKADDKIIVVQKESNKTVSDETETTVQARGLFKVSKGSETINHILNDTDNKFILENSKYPNYDKSLYDSNNLVAKEEIEITLYKPSAIKSIGYYFVPLTDNIVYDDTNLPTGQITPITSNKIENDIVVNGRYIVVAENINGENEVQEIVIKNKRDGSITHPFKVSNPEELESLANSDKYYEVINDIDLSGISWQPIEGFTGHFYGNDYTISNLTITELSNAELSDIGLFSTIKGSINNINLEIDNIDAKVYVQNDKAVVNVGGLAGYILDNTMISGVDVTIDGKFSPKSIYDIAGTLYIGGIIGSIKGANDVNVENCTINNTENSIFDISKEEFSDANIGGAIGYLFGRMDNTTHKKITHNINLHDIKVVNENNAFKFDGKGTVGGAIGSVTDVHISNLEVQNNGVIIEYTNYTAGGAIGNTQAACLENIKVHNENMIAKGSEEFGGIIGIVLYSNLINFECTNKNTTFKDSVHASGMIGVIIYSNVDNFKVYNVENTKILAKRYASGMFGVAYISDIKNVLVENTSTIIESEDAAGGVIAVTSEITFNDLKCNNTNTVIQGNINSGGIFSDLTNSNIKNVLIKNIGVSIGSEQSGGSTSQYASGAIGNVTNGSLYDFECVNKDSRIFSVAYYAGGMIANTFNSNLLNFECTNENSKIESLQFTGGIIGNSDNSNVDNFKVHNMDNTNIISKYIAGGNIGASENDQLSNITAYNTRSAITAGSGESASGGLIGELDYSNLSYAKAVNTDNVITCDENTSKLSWAGGLVGISQVRYSWKNDVLNIKDVEVINNNNNITGKLSGGMFGAITQYNVSNAYTENNNSVITGLHVGGMISSLNSKGSINDDIIILNNSSEIISTNLYPGSAGGAIASTNLSDDICFDVTNNSSTVIKGKIAGGGIGKLFGVDAGEKIKNVTANNKNGSEINGESRAGGMFGEISNANEITFDSRINVTCSGNITSETGSVGALIGAIGQYESTVISIFSIKNVLLNIDNGAFNGNNKGKYYGYANPYVRFNPLLLEGENDLYPAESKLLILPEIPKLPEIPVTPALPEISKDDIIIDKVDLDLEDKEDLEDLGEIKIIEDKEDNEIIDETENTEKSEDIEDIPDEDTEDTNIDIDIIKEELQDIDVDIIEEEIL